jgi:hypothetical protein
MRLVTLPGVDPADLEYTVGKATYARGVQYARQQAVVTLRWDPSEGALYGQVEGNDLYETAAYFSASDGSPFEFEHGECSCPVGFDCKHVAALVLTAIDRERPKRPSPRAAAHGAPSAAWEKSLGTLLNPRTADSTGIPLAIELTLSQGAGPALLARLVQPGKNGWVGGNLSWSRLSSLQHYGNHLAPQVRLLREIHSVYKLRDLQMDYYYDDEKTIDLSTFDSRQLWPMLDEAHEVGVRLAHGLVYVDRADAASATERGSWRLRLAKLDRTLSPQLQRMALGNDSLRIPAADVARFRTEYYPRLRHVAEVTSSDETFTPPAISDPTLVVRAAYGDGHALALDWGWAYEIDDSRLHVPLHPASDDGYRDFGQERAVLADLGLPVDQTALGGIDTMRFTTEVLPLLTDRPGVTVEVSGDPADYGKRVIRCPSACRRPPSPVIRIGSISGSPSPSKGSRFRSRASSWRWRTRIRTCCSPMGPTSRWRSRSCKHCGS